MFKICTLLLIITPSVAPCLLAQGATHCKKVGGSISTNFIDAADTLGTATGDLKGGLGVHVLSVTAGPNGTTILHNHHHWVTETGDTILFDDADATLYPASLPSLYSARYLQGVKIIGGTGRFEKATGNLTNTFGAVDLSKNQIVLRYQGNVCFVEPPEQGSDLQKE